MSPDDLWGNLEKIKRQHLLLCIYNQINYEFILWVVVECLYKVKLRYHLP